MSFDTLNSSMDMLPEYQGQLLRGKVVDNNDPLNLGRIKVSVPNLYDPGLGELPWCGQMKFSTFGQGPTWGVFGSPAVGSDVLILLQNGDPHHPVFISMQSTLDAEFPSGGASWGFRDPYGNVLKVLANESVEFRAVAGVTFTVSPSGDLTVTAQGNTTVNTSGNTTVNTSGDTSVSTGGNLSVQAGGTTSFVSGGNLSFRAPRIDWNQL